MSSTRSVGATGADIPGRPGAPAARRKWWRVPVGDALPWASLVARLVLAVVLGWAALSKIGDPAGTVRAVRAYRILPESFVHPVAYALPAFELALAVLLVLGVATRLVGALAVATLAVFIGAVASAGLRGLRIDCGCFGGGGTVAHTHYLLDIARDSGLLLFALLIPLVRRSRLSVDGRLAVDKAGVDKAGVDKAGVEKAFPDAAKRPGKSPSAKVSARRAKVAAAREAAVRQQARRRQGVAMAAVAGVLVGAAGLGIGVNNSHAASSRAVTAVAPAAATAAGGIVVGSSAAPVKLVMYEDPQCPVCAEFEQLNGTTLENAVVAGKVSVEYRMRSFLGPESVRADNALAAAQQEGKFEALRAAMFANQPREHTGGYSTQQLIELGRSVGLSDGAYADAVRTMPYASWVAQVDDRASRDGNVGTPELIRVGVGPLPQAELFDPARFRAALELS